MRKGLLLPLLALFVAATLLVAAFIFRFAEDEEKPKPADNVATETLTATPPPVFVTETPSQNNQTVARRTDESPAVISQSVDGALQPVPAQLTEALVGEIRKLNPLLASFNPVDRDITALIFEGLTTINEYGEVVPLLAERWEVSRDGLEYIFALRRDILWHDGVPFSSADVQYTINVMRDPDFPGDPALREFWRTMEMTVIDEYTLRFRLVQPLASFPEQLRFGVLPFHVFETYPIARLDTHRFNLSPIGTGPYQMESLLAAEGKIAGVTLRVAPVYRQRPAGQNGFALDRIVFRTYPTVEQALGAFSRGEVNSVGTVPAEKLGTVVALSRLAVHSTLFPAVGVLIYNWQRDAVNYFRDQRARLALVRGLDREAAVKRTLSGWALPAQSPLIPLSWAYDATAVYPVYDQRLAQSMIQSVSFENASAPPSPAATEPAADVTAEPTPEPVRRSFTILVLDKAMLVALAQDIADQWNQLGFTVTVESVSQEDYLQRLQTHDFDTAIVEYSFAPFADPDSFPFWHVGQYPEGLNYGGMRDLQVSDVLARARRENIGINRALLYKQFQELFTDRAPAVTLYHPLYVYVTDNRLQNIQLGFISTPADRFRTLRDWDWELP